MSLIPDKTVKVYLIRDTDNYAPRYTTSLEFALDGYARGYCTKPVEIAERTTWEDARALTQRLNREQADLEAEAETLK